MCLFYSVQSFLKFSISIFIFYFLFNFQDLTELFIIIIFIITYKDIIFNMLFYYLLLLFIYNIIIFIKELQLFCDSASLIYIIQIIIINSYRYFLYCLYLIWCKQFQRVISFLIYLANLKVQNYFIFTIFIQTNISN